MSAFFDNLGKKFSDFGQDVANQTKTLTDSARLASSISSEERKLTALYNELGRAYYKRTKDAPASEDITAFSEIAAAIQKIDSLKKEQAALSGTPKSERAE